MHDDDKYEKTTEVIRSRNLISSIVYVVDRRKYYQFHQAKRKKTLLIKEGLVTFFNHEINRKRLKKETKERKRSKRGRESGIGKSCLQQFISHYI